MNIMLHSISRISFARFSYRFCFLVYCVCYLSRLSLRLILQIMFEQPEKVKFQLRLGQSKPIYDAFKTIQNSSSWSTLSDARKRIVEGDMSYFIMEFLLV